MWDDEAEYNRGSDSDSDGWQSGVWIAVGSVIGALLLGKGKFDGMTAEEWFDEYNAQFVINQELTSCIEDNVDYSSYDDERDLKRKLDEIADCL